MTQEGVIWGKCEDWSVFSRNREARAPGRSTAGRQAGMYQTCRTEGAQGEASLRLTTLMGRMTGRAVRRAESIEGSR